MVIANVFLSWGLTNAWFIMVMVSFETLTEVWELDDSCIGLISTFFAIGLFTGTFTWGYFMDRFGRTFCYRISAIVLLVCSVLMLPVLDYYMLLVLFLIIGNVVSSDMIVSNAIITEFLPLSRHWIIT
jgi:MFS family permease